jgi:hypothetical protein
MLMLSMRKSKKGNSELPLESGMGVRMPNAAIAIAIAMLMPIAKSNHHY